MLAAQWENLEVSVWQRMTGAPPRESKSFTGGWQGSYHPDGVKGTLEGRDDRWTGPTFQFVRSVSLKFGFDLNITTQPAAIRTNAGLELGTTSPWTQCVYAAGECRPSPRPSPQRERRSSWRARARSVPCGSPARHAPRVPRQG